MGTITKEDTYMPPPIIGKQEFKNANGNVIMIVDSEAEQLILHGADGKAIMSVDGIQLKLGDGQVALSKGSGGAALGGYGKFGALVLRDKDNNDIIVLDSGAANLRLGGNTAGGDIALFPKNAIAADLNSFANAIIHLDGNAGNVFLRDEGRNRVTLDAVNGNVHVGGNYAKGNLFVYPSSVTAPYADNMDGSNASIHLDGQASGRIVIRSQLQTDPLTIVFGDVIVLDGQTGSVTLKTDGKSRIHMSAPDANIYVGGNEKSGDIFVYPSGVKGADTTDGSKASIRLDGQNGDVVLSNADCAEEFDIAQSGDIVPGTVMVLNHEGKLQQSKQAYDRKVVGVISGGGDCKPGIILDKKHSRNNRMPLAMLGKVYCNADAQYGPIEVGDLLTTSSTPGHAMKAADALRAFGAVIGKALRPLKQVRSLFLF